MIDVVRTHPAPESLQRRHSWNDDDVVERLHADFHRKCYLCESSVRIRELQVDHRIPRGVDDDLTYEWNNLCPTCGLCNQRRPKYTEVPELLDPCAGADVGGRLFQRLDLTAQDDRFHFSACAVADVAAETTATELRTIHSPPRNAAKRAKAKELRDEIERAHGAISEFLASAHESALAGDFDSAQRHLDDATKRLVLEAEFSALLNSALGDVAAAVKHKLVQLRDAQTSFVE